MADSINGFLWSPGYKQSTWWEGRDDIGLVKELTHRVDGRYLLITRSCYLGIVWEHSTEK